MQKFTCRLLRTIIAFSVLTLFSFLSFTASAQDCGCDHIVGPDKSIVRPADLPNVKPGDVICIKAGVRGRLRFTDFQGTKEQPIIFKNCGGQVVFDNPDFDGTFSVVNSRFFRITGTGSAQHKYGFLIRKAPKGTAMYLNNSDFEVDHVEIANAGFAGIMAKIDPNCGNKQFHRGNFVMDNVSIHDNYIHHTIGEGLYIGSTSYFGKPSECGTLYPHPLENLRIFNNITEETGADGIQVSSATKNVEVYNNTIRRYGVNPFEPAQVNGLQIGGGSTGRYYNNLIIDGIGMGIQCLGMADIYMYNNLVIRPGVDGIFIDERGSVLPGKGFHVHNNTVVSPKRDAIRMYSRNSVGNTFVNNLLVAPGSLTVNYYSKNQYIYIIDDNVKYTQNNNLFIATVNDARFMNAAGNDYKLKQESPAVDKGVVLSYFGFDFSNTARPQGASFDIGALEYTGTVQAPNQLPVVSAGTDKTITLPTDTLVINATATDADGSIASVKWTQTSGTAATMTGQTTKSLRLSKLVAGTYTFRFSATDNAGATQSDDVLVTVKPEPVAPLNVAPVVDAGADRTITLPTNSLKITATATDSDGSIAAVKWTQISGAAATLAGQSTNTLSVSNLVEGQYTFRFTATDNANASTADNVIVTVAPNPNTPPPVPNVAPVVDAGADRTITLPTNSLTITATAKDSDGSIAKLTWTQINGPAAEMIGQNTNSLSLSNLVAGNYTLRFTATDNEGAASSDDVVVSVNPAAPDPVTSPVSGYKGLNYKYYVTSHKDSWSRLPNFDLLTPKKTGVVSNFSLSPATQPDYYGFVFEGFIQIDVAGNYTFYTNSSDGSQLFINGKLIVDNNGAHKPQERSGKVDLTAGMHAIKVTYFEKNSTELLEVTYAGTGFSRKQIPSEKLFTSIDASATTANQTTITNTATTLQRTLDPNAPTNLLAQQISNYGSSLLTWKDNSSIENGYEIFMSVGDNNNYRQVGSTGHNTERYTVAGLSKTKVYYIKIRAKLGQKYSAFSNEVVVGATGSAVTSTPNPTTSLALQEKILVNFNYGMNVAAPWNNFNKDPNPFDKLSNMKNEAGRSTTVGITLLTPWGWASSGYNGHNDYGMVTGNNSGVYPDQVMKTCFWTQRTEAEEMQVTGLEPNQFYAFTFFGSRNAGGNRTTHYTIAKNTVSLNAAYNTKNTVTIYNAKADASGTLKIIVQKDINASYGYLNAMTIEATGYVDTKKLAKGAAATNPVVNEADAENKEDLTSKSPILYSLYPNAATDHINLRYDGTTAGVKLDIQVIDFTGNVRLQAQEITTDENGTIRIELNQDKIPSGYYLVRIVSVNGDKAIRFFKL